MAVVIALGGSLLNLEHPECIWNLGTMFARISREIPLYIVTGGGKTARTYIRAGRNLEASEATLDQLGIATTRLNALLMKAALGDTHPVPSTIEEATDMSSPVVMGGTIPGHSTDAVGALLARAVSAERFIIATDVDGIYTTDPKLDVRATRYPRISITELQSMCPDVWERAGTSTVIDGIACRIIAETHIPTFVLNGKDLDSLENAIYGREFNGTVIEV